MPIPLATRTAVPTKDYQYGFSDPEQFSFKSKRGLNREVVQQISAYKHEPDWMLLFRLRALEIFQRKPLPTWPSADLSEIDFDNIFYYLRPTDNSAENNWDDVPPYIKDTFDKLGIPEAERKFLAGVSAQYESEVVYHSIREDLEKQGSCRKQESAARVVSAHSVARKDRHGGTGFLSLSRLTTKR